MNTNEIVGLAVCVVMALLFYIANVRTTLQWFAYLTLAGMLVFISMASVIAFNIALRAVV